MSERIVSAAVRVGDLIISVPAPGRHHNVVQLMSRLGLGQEHHRDQGFLTSEGRFLDRRMAAGLAKNAGQIQDLQWPPNLYSEDLW